MRECTFAGTAAVLLAAALGLLLPVAAAAQAVSTPVAATEVFDPLNLLKNSTGPVGTFFDSGRLTCPGADPTGDPMQPCPPDRPIHLRDVYGRSRMVSQSPMLNGWFYWRMSADFDAGGSGPAWGKFWVELDDGGLWEGSWTNHRGRVEGEDAWVGHARFVGRGTGGSVEGMQLRFTEVCTTYTLLPFFWVAQVSGAILAPPSR